MNENLYEYKNLKKKSKKLNFTANKLHSNCPSATFQTTTTQKFLNLKTHFEKKKLLA